VVLNVCGSSACILFQVILLAPRIFRCLLIFFLTGKQLPSHETSLKLNLEVSNTICYGAERVMDTSNTKQCVETDMLFNVFFCKETPNKNVPLSSTSAIKLPNLNV
jgi:hypothetical protein